MAKAWLANNNQTDALTWLEQHGIRGQLERAVQPVLLEIWANAWELGVKSARTTTGYQGAPPNQAMQQAMLRYQSQWAAQVINTILAALAAILVAGGAGMVLALGAFLASLDNSARIAQTEITRAMAAGAAETYRQAGVQMVEWVTSEDARVCDLCDANEASGPHFLGQVFPSGAMQPPQHPRCRCALVPVR